MRTNEITWSRRFALRNDNYWEPNEVQQHALMQGIARWGEVQRYHAVLTTESGMPAGSGVCVKSGGQRGLLTARHVLYANGKRKKRLPNPLISFAPSQREMLQEQRRRRHWQPNSGEPLQNLQAIAMSIGNRTTITPLQQENMTCLDPGLPDISVIVFSDDIEEKLRSAALAEKAPVPEPQWVDLDGERQVSVPYGTTGEDDEMLMGSWLITGLRGERSDVKKMYCETNTIAIDRIYRRNECEYYGIFVDEVGGRRDRSRNWGGTSGGGVWQQRLTESGRQKVEQLSPPPLTPEDFELPVLGGVAFFHETRKPPEELRGNHNGTTQYGGELYAHRLGGTLLDLIQRALREGTKNAE